VNPHEIASVHVCFEGSSDFLRRPQARLFQIVQSQLRQMFVSRPFAAV
jgi:hypothetical protein